MKTLYRWTMNPKDNPGWNYKYFQLQGNKYLPKIIPYEQVGNYSLLLIEELQTYLYPAPTILWKMLLTDSKLYSSGLVLFVKPEWVTPLFPNK